MYIIFILFPGLMSQKDRPEFRDILLSFLGREKDVLHVPLNVTDSHPQAATRGAPLVAGFHMYDELQKLHMPNTQLK